MAGKETLQPGFDDAMQMMSGFTRNWQAMAVEWSDHSKRVFEDGAATLEAMMSAGDIGRAAELQRAYLARCYEANMKQFSKLGGMYSDLTKDMASTLEKGATGQRRD